MESTMNHLQHETSPYLLQHAGNPVHWYPWCDEAFVRAKAEDKPIFLSIGYSTCHWCHVMAHESFEDDEIAALLNRYFIAIKVDREERPDIDSVYMSVCQAMTGSGGWPTSIWMTADQEPFFAGTYFPKRNRGGMMGFYELLTAIHLTWTTNRAALLAQSKNLLAALSQPDDEASRDEASADEALLDAAVHRYERAYDRRNGGFGRAPKFPSPHNLLFLLSDGVRRHHPDSIDMAEHTLMQMYRGGLFDHVGGGFSRYSTDERFLVPHFEKMLYDNALLILTYCRAHAVTADAQRAALFLKVARKAADYVLRELTSPEGGFYSAQDADSEGEEGKYYTFTPGDMEGILDPKDAAAFCRRFDITSKGNFEGRSIPNLLDSDPFDDALDKLLPQVYAYRKTRYALHLDDKILTAWNGWMIVALCALYLCSGEERYLHAAQKADACIRQSLWEEPILHASFAGGRRGAGGFLDDYAVYAQAQLALYRATLEPSHLAMAQTLCRAVTERFADERGGFYLYARDSERLILRPKETYDGAAPSGNSTMAVNLVQLAQLTGSEEWRGAARKQMNFMSGIAASYPTGYAMFLCAWLDELEPPMKVTIVDDQPLDAPELLRRLPLDTLVLRQVPTKALPMKNGRTTFYVCEGRRCHPPVNDLQGILP